MIKCYVCKSENIKSIGIMHKCEDCGDEWREVIEEPSTAEKLLWLVENRELECSPIAIRVSKTEDDVFLNRWFRFGENPTKAFDTLEQAINAAYSWAKEQEK